MKLNSLVQFIKLFFFDGLLKSLAIGTSLSLSLFGLIAHPKYCIGFSVFVSLFYITGTWRAYMTKRYFAIIRRLILIIYIGSFIATTYMLEAGIMSFFKLNWTVVFVLVLATMILWTTYLLLKEYFKQSWVYVIISKNIKYLQTNGLLPKDKK